MSGAPSDQSRAYRIEAICQLLEQQKITRQDHIVEALVSAGFAVTQSSVSRDLRELGVRKVGGVYAMPGRILPQRGPETQTSDLPMEQVTRIVADAVLSVLAAGPHLLVLKTTIGAAARVAFALDQLGAPEILGTIAGDDTIFIACAGAREQQAIERQIASHRLAAR